MGVYSMLGSKFYTTIKNDFKWKNVKKLTAFNFLDQPEVTDFMKGPFLLPNNIKRRLY